MGLFKDWKGTRYIIQLCIIKLVCCLGWLSAIVSGQMELSETVSGSASFPDLGITCLGNLAVFFSSFLRGRLHLEIGAKDVLAILTGRIKLKNIEEDGWEDIKCFKLSTSRKLTDCSVLMLSREMPNSSMRQFLEYIANVHGVRSILLQYFPLQSLPLTVQICNCERYNNDRCKCIVFYGAEAIIQMLVRRMPGLTKQLSGSMYLLPCAPCVNGRCHGCNEGRSYEVCHALPRQVDKVAESFHCICIPVDRKLQDRWTKLLIRSFKSKDNEARGAMSTELSVSDALGNYIAGSGKAKAEEEYSVASVTVPRLAEIAINLALTFWFKLDGFSSALVARRAIREYIVDDSGKGLAAHVFISKARVITNSNYTDVCQLLSFRGNLLSPGTLSVIVGSVNLICSVSWAVLIAMEGGANKWYLTHSIAPSEGRVYAIMMGIGIAMGMDFVDLISILRISPSCYNYRQLSTTNYRQHLKHIILMCGVITLEIVCFVSGITMVRVLGVKCCARWRLNSFHSRLAENNRHSMANVSALSLAILATLLVGAYAGDMMRKSIVFDKNTPDVFYCPQHKPTGFEKMIVRAKPLSRLCQFEGGPIPEDYKSDCYNDVDETEYACKEKYRIMKRFRNAEGDKDDEDNYSIDK